MGGTGCQNIEHPHTLAILSSLFVHFSFIGKAQFGRATLFCDSSYCLSILVLFHLTLKWFVSLLSV